MTGNEERHEAVDFTKLHILDFNILVEKERLPILLELLDYDSHLVALFLYTVSDN